MRKKKPLTNYGARAYLSSVGLILDSKDKGNSTADPGTAIIPTYLATMSNLSCRLTAGLFRHASTVGSISEARRSANRILAPDSEKKRDSMPVMTDSSERTDRCLLLSLLGIRDAYLKIRI